MKTLGISVLIILIITTLCVTSAQAATQSTPFLIYGYVSYEDGSECNDPSVNITNLDTEAEWQAVKNASFNYFQIMLVNGTDLNGSEWLEFSVTSPDGNQSNITEHNVTQDEVDAGGFEYNITLEIPPDTTSPVITSATANPATIEANGSDNTLLNVTATDLHGIASVTINLSAIGGSPIQLMTNNSGVWQFITNTTIVGTFELPINVTDNAGISNTSCNI